MDIPGRIVSRRSSSSTAPTMDPARAIVSISRGDLRVITCPAAPSARRTRVAMSSTGPTAGMRITLPRDSYHASTGAVWSR